MSKISSMGHFTAIGMRVHVPESDALVISTCSNNDTSLRGNFNQWSWSNPTNRAIEHHYEGISAVSVESLWQGTKIFQDGGRPDPETLRGDWRRGKAKRPIGAWAGEGNPLICRPGDARRKIYIPAFERLILHWTRKDDQVADWIEQAKKHPGPVYLRDHDVGRGIDRNGPMSHAWVLATYLNTYCFPD
jgi:hypothetical protein